MGQRSMDDFFAMFCCGTALVKVDHHGGIPAHYTRAPFAGLDWPLRGRLSPVTSMRLAPVFPHQVINGDLRSHASLLRRISGKITLSNRKPPCPASLLSTAAGRGRMPIRRDCNVDLVWPQQWKRGNVSRFASCCACPASGASTLSLGSWFVLRRSGNFL